MVRARVKLVGGTHDSVVISSDNVYCLPAAVIVMNEAKTHRSVYAMQGLEDVIANMENAVVVDDDDDAAVVVDDNEGYEDGGDDYEGVDEVHADDGEYDDDEGEEDCLELEAHYVGTKCIVDHGVLYGGPMDGMEKIFGDEDIPRAISIPVKNNEGKASVCYYEKHMLDGNDCFNAGGGHMYKFVR